MQDTLLGTAIESHPLTDTTFFAIGGDRRGSGSDIKPLMLKYDNRRNELGINSISMEQINPEYERGLFTNAILTDTAFYFGGGFFKSGLYPHMIDAKFDTDFLNPNYQAITHNIRNIRSSNYYFHTTYDDNIIIANEKRLPSQVLADIYVTKLSPDFSPCSTNLTPLTYDSLCTTPGLPQSGFISLDDCELFTDIDEIPNAKEYQEKIRWIPITAYPNPVTEGKLTLELENTKHHQDMQLRCYDDFGRQIHSQKIYKGQQDTELDVSNWPPGIYIAVVYSDGSARGKAKFVVR